MSLARSCGILSLACCGIRWTLGCSDKPPHRCNVESDSADVSSASRSRTPGKKTSVTSKSPLLSENLNLRAQVNWVVRNVGGKIKFASIRANSKSPRWWWIRFSIVSPSSLRPRLASNGLALMTCNGINVNAATQGVSPAINKTSRRIPRIPVSSAHSD